MEELLGALGNGLLAPLLKVKRQFDIKIYKLRLITLNNMAGSNKTEFIIFSGVWKGGNIDIPTPQYRK